MTDLAIKVQDLSFSYPNTQDSVLKNISFEIAQGEFVAICGPSGAGKTTLALALRAIIPHTVPGRMQGSVQIFGEDTRKTTASKLTGMLGLVQQDAEAQIVGLTVEDDLAYGMENMRIERTEMKRRIRHALQMVGLPGLEQRETHALSGGQKQRLAIASTLVLQPQIIILDEPTSELDPVGKWQVFQIIAGLREAENVTIVMVEHEMDYLAEHADRLMALDQGVIVANGSPKQFFNNDRVFSSAPLERRPDLFELYRELKRADWFPDEVDSFFASPIVGARILDPIIGARIDKMQVQSELANGAD